MFRNISKRKRLTGLAIIVALLAAGGAYAFWSGSGSGSATATVGDGGTVTLSASVTGLSTPGTAVPVTFAAANATASAIEVGTVNLVTVEADAGHAACETDDFSMADVVQDHVVPAGATAEALPTDGSLVFAESGINQDACKGAVLTLTVASN